MTTFAASFRRVALFSYIVFTFLPRPSAAIGLITPERRLTSQETLVSAEQGFELGFLSLGKSDRWYAAIWYRNVEPRTVIWVANRDSPLGSAAASLVITAGGKLSLVDEFGKSVWFSNSSSADGGAVAELLDNGNFVVRKGNDYLWQSFDFPTDTLMPGMKMGWDLKSGLDRFITSWKASDDPSSGEYTFRLDARGFPEVYLRYRDEIKYRSGPWNGLKFSGEPEMTPNHVVSYSFTMSAEEVTYSFDLLNGSVYSRLVMKHYGQLQRLTWIPSAKIWSLYWYAPKDQCDDYGECGPNGICDVNSSPVCKCLAGFEPRNPTAWSLRDGSDGCVLGGEFDCGTDGFLRLNSVKLPAAVAATVDTRMNSSECRELCRRNCSCSGYSDANITNGGSGCVIWAEDFYDMRQFSAAQGGQDVHLRVPAALLEKSVPVALNKIHKNKLSTSKVAGIAASSATLLLLILLSAFITWKRLQHERTQQTVLPRRAYEGRSQELLLRTPSKRDNPAEEELDLPVFDFNTLLIATGEFSESNKLGKGGFGAVYKGKLEDGQEIAVKRLSKTSVQGNEEFTNEAKMIARLQHRNLVRLLGCCVEMEEKLLIYEYMENKSLDSVLFRADRSSKLDWPTRFSIICGIARGLLYLHQDSRFRIVHRDLKASNILLDREMNPKISDFGMARIFGGDQTEAETRRVVGTYGYMSPEYAMGGVFSVKSDVFSFGILVLEIVSGTKNRGFTQANDHHLHLPAHAWRLHDEGRASELLDGAITGTKYSASEVTRCIRVGLLCVQEQPDDRPNMSAVAVMLSSDDVPIPRLKFPGYCLGTLPGEKSSSRSKQEETCSVNQVTVTMLEGR